MMISGVYGTEISNGIEFLNRLAGMGDIPQDWYRGISLQRLDLFDTEDCVLGQVFQSCARMTYHETGYDYAAATYEFTMTMALEMGFALPYDSTYEEYETLTREWATAITALLEAELV